ncbi:MAG: inorganic pyrophosphatase, partial [Aeromicrobium sp.]
YKALEPGKYVEEGSKWLGREAAEKEIVESFERFKANGGY